MTAAALVREARTRGVTLRLVDGAVKLFAPRKPAPELLARLREAKAEVAAVLAPICEHCRHFARDDGPRRRHRCRLGGYCLDQRQCGECGKTARLWEPAP